MGIRRWLSLASLVCSFFAASLEPAHADPLPPATALPATTLPPTTLPPTIPVSEREEPLFETLDRTRGLTSLATNDLLVDRHGFLWIATDGGLHRFDGRNIYTVDRDPNRHASLASRRVYRLADTSDALWLGFVDGVVQRLDMATGRLSIAPVRLPGAGSPRNVSWMHGDAYGRVWLLTDLGLLRYDPSARTTLLVASKPRSAQISRDGRRLFLVTDDFQVTSMHAGTLAERRTLARLPDADASTAVRTALDADGLWLAHGTRLWRLDIASASLRAIAIPPLPISRLAAQPDGIVWMSTYSREGLYRLDAASGTLDLYRYRPGDPLGLRVRIIKVMTISAEGDLWLGGFSGGVGRVRLRSGVARIHLDSYSQDLICGISENAKRQLFMAFCDKGRLGRLDLAGGQFSDLTPALDRALPRHSPAIMAQSLAADGADGLWMATDADGLLHWKPGQPAVQFPYEDALLSAFRDDRNRIWAAHLNGLAVLLPGTQTLQEASGRTAQGAFAFGRTSSVSQGTDGTLWVGTTHGLIHYWPQSGQVRQFVSQEDDPRSLTDNNVDPTYVDRAGRVWVGTLSGLNRMVVDTSGKTAFRRYGKAEGLPDITIVSILGDATGAVWVATNRGIARWDPRRDRFQAYLPSDGFPDVDVTGGGRLGSDGKLYFATDAGLWRIDPAGLRTPRPSPAVLSGYQVGDATVINLRGRDLREVRAGFQDRRLTFSFTALGDPRNLFYRLAGFDDRWQSMPANLTVGYHQLPPGRYRLQVSRVDSAGKRTIELTMPVAVEPPPWRTAWAYALYLLAIAAAIGWMVRGYTIRRRRRREYVRVLREKDERLRLAMSASGDVMIEIDVQKGSVTETGDDAEVLSAHGAIGIPDYLDLIHPDDVGAVARYFEALRQQGTQEQPIEYRRRTAEPGWKWVRLRGRFIAPDRLDGNRDRDRAAKRIFTGMVHDITQERADQEMRQRTDQLRMQAEVRGQFLAVISHEIRTPLNGVVGMIELLGTTALSAEQRKMSDACRDAAYILLSIINDFLDLSKIEAGKLELERSDVRVRELVEATAVSQRVQAMERGLRLDIHVAPDVPAAIVGDWVRLRQILGNLLSNAVKFTEQGGVEVAARMEGPGELRLTVTDTGIGMDQETVLHLFEPFQQASAATARRFGGTGLGLSIVKHLVDIMGGRIECDSRVGEGTRFDIVLPIEATPLAAPAWQPLRGLRVLALVASERSRYLREPLAWLGADVEFVPDAGAALARVGDAMAPRVDVLLIDQDAEAQRAALPGEVTALGLPVVAMTGRTTPHPTPAGQVVLVEGNPVTAEALVQGIELALGKGAETATALPATERVLAESSGADGREPQRRGKILLAEDNPINREVIARQLDRLGFACDIAEDGEEAWTLLTRQNANYDLLITDAQMPRLDGYQLAARIREHEARADSERTPRTKILMITAGVLAGERERCLALGMDGFLSKPLSLESLREKLRELLPGLGARTPHAGSEPPLPGDFVGVSQLLDLLQGNRGQLRRILNMFLRTTQTDMASMESAWKLGDRRQAGALAHRLKSACAQLGQHAAGQSLEDIERAAGAAHIDDTDFDRLMAVARDNVAQARALIGKYLAMDAEP